MKQNQVFTFLHLGSTLVWFSLLHQDLNHLEMKLIKAHGGCLHPQEFHVNLRNLVVIVRYFVLLDEAVSYVFQSLISKLISIDKIKQH